MTGWIRTADSQPEYYRNVLITLKDGSILDNWHRVSDGEKDYYCSPNTDAIIMADDVVKYML